MRRNIQRVSHNTCDCVYEQVVVTDDVLVFGMVIKDPEFLLMNRVCEKHISLASTSKKEEHPQLAQNVLDIIEETKAVNLKQVDDLIAKATRVLEKEDLIKCRELVLAHNDRITREWQELASFTHAFDSHIHDKIRAELPIG